MTLKWPARVVLLLGGLVLLWLLGWGLGAIVHGLATSQTLAVDRPVHDFLVDHRSGVATAAMRALTHVGGFRVLLPVVAVAGLAWFLGRRTLRPVLLLAAAYAGSAALTEAIKGLVDRPRPPMADVIGHISGSSFPSGHALDSMAVYGAIALLVTRSMRSRRARLSVWSAALLLVAGIAFTRLYLGVHWLTDVLAGMLLGGLWIAMLNAALPRRGAGRPDASPASRSASGPPP